MTPLGMFLLSNHFWYGFFIGFMAVIGTAYVVVLAIRARQTTNR